MVEIGRDRSRWVEIGRDSLEYGMKVLGKSVPKWDREIGQGEGGVYVVHWSRYTVTTIDNIG